MSLKLSDENYKSVPMPDVYYYLSWNGLTVNIQKLLHYFP